MTILSAFFTSWKLKNLDNDEELEGDFEAQNVTQNISATYADVYALNSRAPITQFLHGNAKTLTFQGRFFFDPAVFSIVGAASFPGTGALTVIDRFSSDLLPPSALTTKPAEKLAILEEWTREINPLVGRPPLVEFSVGDELSQRSVIESISNIIFDRPMATGEVRGVTFTVTLREYTPYSLEVEQASAKPGFSRWHNAKKGDYYELIAAKEYKVPLIGDVVRYMNPSKPTVTLGDRIRFPSYEAIRLEKVVPRSTTLKKLNTSEDTAQRVLRQSVLERVSKPYTTFTIPEGL